MIEYTGDITAIGTTRLLESIRRSGIKAKFYQASSSAKITFEEIVKIMVDADLESIGINPPGEGKKILREKEIYWTTNQMIVE